jgi:hypothetical protein
VKFETDTLYDNEIKGKLVAYLLDSEDCSLLIETVEMDQADKNSYSIEINEIVNSITVT